MLTLLRRPVAVDRLTNGLLEGSASGLMGLAFPAIVSTKSTPFWQPLGSQLAKDEEPGGVFTLGGTNLTLFTGEIDFLNMPSGTPTFWLLTMSG
ncbi:uncharacterized protein LACBIDRAFT_299501 [Laccaria bicolor S238N-H82]|uniref:Predicted protein n=1 Tax=Laccaria bicolor (strain S238N-H82 / ATCC MYA-4686) TaxID=486041 RepID=B0DET9_LACBS|nr:uncharacterized protein LACBIDRAFT_299501 [Laccaria bicolor S238N-H82]EDR06999.1 predicted protein [Laccaria bicolor S238N-H82]|eukprot:XP_001882372.1 predicted protein [Laccaria bicolor S238N-H82]